MATRQPDFYSSTGNPVYRETDLETKHTYLVVVMPNGKAYYADAYGRPTRPSTSNPAAGAVLGGLVGLVWGPVGAIVGAAVGALIAGGGNRSAGPQSTGARGA